MYLFFIYAPVCILMWGGFCCNNPFTNYFNPFSCHDNSEIESMVRPFFFFFKLRFFFILQNLLLLCVYLAKFGIKGFILIHVFK